MPGTSDQRQGSQILDQSAFPSLRLGITHLRPPSNLIYILSQVEPGKLEIFHSTYGNLLKASMTTLRKRDKKREKQRAEEIAKRKRRLAEDIVVEGPKRGNGRRKRQRKMKAALRLEESRKRAQEREEAKVRSKST